MTWIAASTSCASICAASRPFQTAKSLVRIRLAMLFLLLEMFEESLAQLVESDALAGLHLLAALLLRRIDTAGEQIKPSAGFSPGFGEHQSTASDLVAIRRLALRRKVHVTEEPARRVLGMARISRHEHKAFVAAIGDAQAEPGHARIEVIDALAFRRGFPRSDELDSEIFPRHRLLSVGQRRGNKLGRLPVSPRAA